MTNDRRIYVACLASYNAGKLHGVWIDCDGLDEDDLAKRIAEMLAESPEPGAEEFAIHDHEGFEGFGIGEFSPLLDVVTICDLLDEYGDDAARAAMNITDCLGDLEDTLSDRYAGEYDSPQDWAEEYLNDTGQLDSIPETLRYYFDFEAFARDCGLSGDMSFVEFNGKTHVFYR